MVARFAPLPLAICLAGLRLILCQTSFGDDYTVNDLDDYQIYERGYDTFEDEAIDNTYFNPYAGDYDDPYGDSILQDFAVIQDCQIAADGSATFNGTRPCDLQIQGVDKLAPGLSGGMDGVYKVVTCENGRPLYKRDTKDKTVERVLWYSSPHQDWDITNGSSPQEEDILMWGGFAGKESRPQQIKSAWHLAAEFMANFTLTSPEYAEVDATVSCIEGSVEEEQPQVQQYAKSSLLTDEEQDAQYRAVIQAARKNADVNGGLNSGLVVLFVAVGLGIVVGLPFMIAKRRGMRRAPGDKQTGISLATFFGGKQAHSS